MLHKSPASHKKVTIIGDTSKFHLGSKLNYCEFRKLVSTKYDILQEIPYNAFAVNYIPFQEFFDQIKISHWWDEITYSDILIVQGEGLTEKKEDYVYPYLYFSRIAKEIGVESWLVNFSMYEGESYLDLLKQFSYIACRDTLTYNHLSKLGISPELSFDCSILASGVEEHTGHNDTISAIRGRNAIDERILHGFERLIKYNCCWQWDSKDARSYPHIHDYVSEMKKCRFTLSTSFHGGIISYMSGIPFISLDSNNKKYLALNLELLPKDARDMDPKIYLRWCGSENRKRVHDHYLKIYDNLKKRTLLNCI